MSDLSETKRDSSDIISRQAAIDALNNHLDTIPLVNNTDAEMIRRDEIMDCRDIIQQLPSAQPVITCDGCRFVSTYDTDLPCCNCVRREKDYYAPER